MTSVSKHAMSSGKGGWAISQMQRFRELNAAEQVLGQKFPNSEERNKDFLRLERNLVRQSQQNLQALRTKRRRPRLCESEDALMQTYERIYSCNFVRKPASVFSMPWSKRRLRQPLLQSEYLLCCVCHKSSILWRKEHYTRQSILEPYTICR